MQQSANLHYWTMTSVHVVPALGQHGSGDGNIILLITQAF